MIFGVSVALVSVCVSPVAIFSLSPLQVMVAELTRIGEEMNCTSECLQIIRDRLEPPSPPPPLLYAATKPCGTYPTVQRVHMLCQETHMCSCLDSATFPTSVAELSCNCLGKFVNFQLDTYPSLTLTLRAVFNVCMYPRYLPIDTTVRTRLFVSH